MERESSPDAPRRRFVGGALAALATAAAMPRALRATGAGAPAPAPATSTATATGPRLIDVHHHLFPPSLSAALAGTVPAFGMPDAARSLAAMDEAGTSVGMVSYPSFDLQRMARERNVGLVQRANDEAAAIVQASAGRHGLFASLPMPHVDESLRELARALDELKADGVQLNTSYGQQWLGDAAFAPLMDELHRRGAAVFVHPGSPACCTGLVPGLPDAIVEFETDTARTLASLVFSGTAERCPGIRFIFPHAGGTMPSLVNRFVNVAISSPAAARNAPRGALAYLGAFHYDTATAVGEAALGALLKIVPATQVLFGTDFPYVGTAAQVAALRQMALPGATLDALLAGNAQRLFPRLAPRA